MNPTTFNEELETLTKLVTFKGYKRYGCVFYAKYDFYKPECTVSELVWGFCRNPCYARQLARELSIRVPDFADVLSKSNQLICSDTVYQSFDQAMAQICKKDNAPQMVFSTEGTSSYDETYENVQILNATEDDGELWHGLLMPSSCNGNTVDYIKICMLSSSNPGLLLWQHTFKTASVAKRIKQRGDLRVFQPFKNPFPLLDLDVRIVTTIVLKKGHVFAEQQQEPIKQLFSVCSTAFCTWLIESSIEIGLCKNSIALIEFPEHSIEFTTK